MTWHFHNQLEEEKNVVIFKNNVILKHNIVDLENTIELTNKNTN